MDELNISKIQAIERMRKELPPLKNDLNAADLRAIKTMMSVVGDRFFMAMAQGENEQKEFILGHARDIIRKCNEALGEINE